MKQRHKHADVIIAWAEGKDVQVWDGLNNKWCDLTLKDPNFRADKYRIKPITSNYRVALLLNDDNEPYTVSVNNQDYADIIEQRTDFVRWLTDWVEYEE
mgnify:CR=1 FL=1